MTQRYSEAILTCRDTQIDGDGLNYKTPKDKAVEEGITELRDSGMTGAAEWAEARLNAPDDIPEDTLDKIEQFERMGWTAEAARYRTLLSYSDAEVDAAILARQ